MGRNWFLQISILSIITSLAALWFQRWFSWFSVHNSYAVHEFKYQKLFELMFLWPFQFMLDTSNLKIGF